MKRPHYMFSGRSVLLLAAGILLLALPACGGDEGGADLPKAVVGNDAAPSAAKPHAKGMPPVMPKGMPKGMPPAGDPGPGPEAVVCTVDGEPILQKEIDAEISRSVLRGQHVPAAQMPMIRSRFGPKVEKMLIERKLLAAAAKKAGGEVTADEIEARWKDIEARVPPGTTRAQILQRSGMTAEQAVEEIGLGIRIEKLIKKHHPITPVTDEDVKKHYDSSLDRFTIPPQARARHILLKFEPGASAEQKAVIRKKMDDIRAELLKKDGGKDFATLAAEHSACPSSSKGGDLGTYPPGKMVPEFDKLMFSMDLGVVSEPFTTQFGYHIMEVLERTESKTRPFEEVKAGIRSHLEGTGQQKAQADYVETLRKAAKIERPAAK